MKRNNPYKFESVGEYNERNATKIDKIICNVMFYLIFVPLFAWILFFA